MQFSSSEVVEYISCSWHNKTSSTAGNFLPRFSERPLKVGSENYSTRVVKKNCRKSLLDRLDCFADFCGNDSASTPFSAITTQLFSQSLSSHTLCSCLEIFSTITNICNFWYRKIQQVNTYAFCSWDDIFTQKRIAVLPLISASAPNLQPGCRPIPL